MILRSLIDLQQNLSKWNKAHVYLQPVPPPTVINLIYIFKCEN